MLSNLNVGVYFNDNTKIVKDENKNYYYYEREGAEKIDKELKFSFDNIPARLEKKVLIHERFARYIVGDDPLDDQMTREGSSDDGVHIKKWLRTQHAMMFRLSNYLVQVCFQDQTEVLLCTNTKLVTFKTRAGTMMTFTMRKALEMENKVGTRTEEI